MQNIIVLGRNNPVSLDFFFDDSFSEMGLNNFTRIVVNIGDEEYSTDTSAVSVHSITELRIRVGTETSLVAGSYPLTITGYSTTYTEGYELTSVDVSPISDVTVV